MGVRPPPSLIHDSRRLLLSGFIFTRKKKRHQIDYFLLGKAPDAFPKKMTANRPFPFGLANYGLLFSRTRDGATIHIIKQSRIFAINCVNLSQLRFWRLFSSHIFGMATRL